MYANNSKDIQALITNYFQGIYKGKIKELEKVFHPRALLFGDINGVPYFKSLADYIKGVKNRKSPHELGEEFKMKILSVEINGDMAIAKLHVPMLGFNYYDFISLAKVDGNWKIVNKLFTHVV
ncbi:nuclear transport factor 2 family protein [Xanthovirga aplysinae]|uniref:nuclear transport factor 2 family protein n=1 Tax=Xanthovirga aplysinae TaxID=2529853 RepID=UPI0012BBB364|nr:nuclear transport factor 2 family protein [Xanthovirga aplysinae]MTI31265.1 nuclear transport factor 2 family protein [Xanthovirga aplysinae]